MKYNIPNSSHFIQKELKNIRAIAARHGELIDDVTQETHLIILENQNFYDSSLGSFESFILGLLHHSIKRKTFGPLKFAISLDTDSPTTETYLQILEQVSFEKYNEVSTELNLIPGHLTLKSIATAIGSRSSTEIGRSLKLSKRRINQILKEIQNDAGNQFGLDFDGSKQ